MVTLGGRGYKFAGWSGIWDIQEARGGSWQAFADTWVAQRLPRRFQGDSRSCDPGQVRGKCHSSGPVATRNYCCKLRNCKT